MLVVALTSYDGFGNGKSLTWHYEALNIAKEKKEACEHLNINNIILKMKSFETEKGHIIRFKVKCSDCRTNLIQTSESLSEKFLKFYGK